MGEVVLPCNENNDGPGQGELAKQPKKEELKETGEDPVKKQLGEMIQGLPLTLLQQSVRFNNCKVSSVCILTIDKFLRETALLYIQYTKYRLS